MVDLYYFLSMPVTYFGTVSCHGQYEISHVANVATLCLMGSAICKQSWPAGGRCLCFSHPIQAFFDSAINLTISFKK